MKLTDLIKKAEQTRSAATAVSTPSTTTAVDKPEAAQSAPDKADTPKITQAAQPAPPEQADKPLTKQAISKPSPLELLKTSANNARANGGATGANPLNALKMTLGKAVSPPAPAKPSVEVAAKASPAKPQLPAGDQLSPEKFSEDMSPAHAGAEGDESQDLLSLDADLTSVAAKYIFVEQAESMPADDIVTLVENIAMIEAQMGNKEIIGQCIVTVMQHLQAHPFLAGILKPEGIGMMVRGLRESYGLVVSKKTERKDKRSQSAAKVDEIMSQLKGFSFK